MLLERKPNLVHESAKKQHEGPQAILKAQARGATNVGQLSAQANTCMLADVGGLYLTE